MTVTVEYRCEDGTPFPVRFRDESEAARTWALEREHGRDPATPLWQSLNEVAVPGAQRCYDELGLVLPPSFRGGPDAMGFAYFDETPMSADEMATMFTGCGALVEKHGSALGIWHELNLPRTKAAIAEIATTESFRAIAELHAYGQQHTMIPAFVCGNDLTLLEGAIEPVVGPDEAPLLARELTQGFENETLRADQRLWEVAQLARTTGGPVLEALTSTDDVPAAMASLRADAGASDEATAAFFAAVDAFLADYGFRAEGWDIACPTWSEEGEGFWAQVRQLSSPSAPAPAQAVAKGAARRAALVAELEARFGDDDAALGRFRRRMARIEPYVAVREERAMWQVAISGAARHAALRRGQALVEGGSLSQPDDVLFMTVDELDSGAVPRPEVIAERRAEHERRCRLVPPARIGGGLDASSGQAGDRADRVLRGRPASRGVASGPARVIVDLADADRLEPGDVLVCVMTSPPWTPLFGLASAVVVDTGDIGSHPAIAAREYGIPCVVGCGDATRTLVDGELVTVDGAAGTVQPAG